VFWYHFWLWLVWNPRKKKLDKDTPFHHVPWGLLTATLENERGRIASEWPKDYLGLPKLKKSNGPEFPRMASDRGEFYK
jgi:hypothetical protein